MTFPLYLIIALASGIIYTVSALFSKRALNAGVSMWLLMLTANCAVGILTFGMWPLGGHAWSTIPFFPPAAIAALFLLGQYFTLEALNKGDASVATPLLGTKVIMVAVFTLLVIRQNPPATLWAGAALASAGLFFLRGPAGKGRGNYGATVVYSLLCAASFALCDILIQKWSPLYGAGRLMPLTFAYAGIGSLCAVPFAHRAGLLASKGQGTWIFWSCVLTALQAVGMAVALSLYGHATAVNILYSTRGIWMVLLIWIGGQWFNNFERDVGSATMIARLTGAALLFGAVMLALI
jgi:drug/metabolite transporter (DMT)-like permease